MATETVYPEVSTETPADNKAVVRKGGPEHTLFQPGNKMRVGKSPKISQMATWRDELEAIDPETQRPRLAELFDQIYRVAVGTATWHNGHDRVPRNLSGKDMVAAATFLIEQSYGKAPSQEDSTGNGIRVVQINIPELPAGSRMAIGLQAGDPVTPCFPEDE